MATDVWSGKNGSFTGTELMSLYRNAENTALQHLLKRPREDADQPLDFSRSKSSNRSNDLERTSPIQGAYIKEGLASRLEDSQIVNSPDSQKAFVQELSTMSLKSSPSQSNNVRHKPYSKESPAIPNKTNHDNSVLALALKTATPMESHVPLMMVANGQMSPVLPATSPDVILNSSPVLGNPYVLFPPNCNGMIKLGTDDMKAPGKSIRPFKAYEHEILGQDSSFGSMRALSDPSLLARQSVLNGPAHYPRTNSSNNPYSPADSSTLRSHLESSQQPKPSSGPQNGGVSTSSPDSEGIKDSECSSDSNMSHDRLNDHHHPDTSNGMTRRRKTERYPDNLKDEAYWERRRKNNEAAKRSRDTRRQKEDAIALRAKDLLDKNRQLGYYLTCQTQNMQHMQNQMRLLSEKHVESVQENKELKELLQKVAKFVEACPRCCTKDFQLLG